MTDLTSPSTITNHSGCVDNERILLDRIEAQRRELSQLRTDFDIIAKELFDESVRRQWCSEYEDFVAKVNDATTNLKLITRDREWNVEHVYTVRVRGTVTAFNYDDAVGRANLQYGGIREAHLFVQPDGLDDHVLPAIGQLTEVGWSFEHSLVFDCED